MYSIICSFIAHNYLSMCTYEDMLKNFYKCYLVQTSVRKCMVSVKCIV